MNLVIDANILIAALLKDSKVRELIVHTKHRLFVPEIILIEIQEHKDELLKKSSLSEKEFEIILSTLTSYLNIVQDKTLLLFLNEANSIIGNIDKDDVSFVAASLAYNKCPIWSDDTHFQQQNEIKVLTTKDIIDLDNA